MNNESYDFENRKYINPTLSRDEQLAFADNLRSVQQNDMAKIARDTHNLGTDVPSNLGGLSGSEGLWRTQYVDPKVNAMISGLQSAAQAQALNDVLNNYQSQMKQRYNEAYRAASKRKDALDSGSDGGNNNDDDDDENKPDYVPSDSTDNGSDIDTVTEHSDKVKAKNLGEAVNNINNITGSTGGGQLPAPTTGKVYYLHAPDGSKFWVNFNNSYSGWSLDTPSGSYAGQSGIDYINNKLKQGYRLSNEAGDRDVPSGLWRMITGYNY